MTDDVKMEVIAAARAAANGRGGWAKVSTAALVKQFAGRASQASVYRWVAEAKEKRSGRVPVDAPFAAPPVQPGAAAVPLPVTQLVQMCVQAGQDVMAASRGPDGKPRNSKMLIRATDTLRRCLETAVRLQESITDALALGEYDRIILEEIAKIDTAVAARITARLLELNATYSARLGVEAK